MIVLAMLLFNFWPFLIENDIVWPQLLHFLSNMTLRLLSKINGRRMYAKIETFRNLNCNAYFWRVENAILL